MPIYNAHIMHLPMKKYLKGCIIVSLVHINK